MMVGLLAIDRDTGTNRVANVIAAANFFLDETTLELFLGDGINPGGRMVGCPSAPESITGTSYTVLDTDAGVFYSFNTGSHCAVALAEAASSGGSFFPAQTGFWLYNQMAGNVVITPATSTINGASALTLYPNDQAFVFSDGVNYWALVFRAAAKAVAFSGLPGSPVLGQQAIITDSTVNTFGAAITVGSGTHTVRAWYNGTNWTVTGI